MAHAALTIILLEVLSLNLGVGCDLLVHFGHSCLVPISTTLIKTLYVFVDISFDLDHFIETFKVNFEKDCKIALVATIQFVSSLQVCIC